MADTPDDLVFELHAETLWPDHPYGYSILGTPRDAGAVSGPTICAASTRPGTTRATAWWLRRGTWSTASCSPCSSGRGGSMAPAASRRPDRRSRPRAAARARYRVEARDTAQTHVVFGTDTFALRDPRRFPLAILTNVFGGGMSSRLFQRVREELGLAYAVFALQAVLPELRPAGRVRRHPDLHRRPGRSRRSGRSTTGSRGKGCRPTSWRTASSSSRGRSCSRWRARWPGWAGWPASPCTTTVIARSTRCWPRSTRSPRTTVADGGGRVFPPERQTVVRLGPEQ